MLKQQLLEQLQQKASKGGGGGDKALCLLSLDGGGVRGLSTLVILDELMRKINPKMPPKPCEIFDMIGGTSTGGLITIMLGRLQMSIKECRAAYRDLSDGVFQAKNYIAAPWWTMPWNWELKGRFDSDALEKGIKKIVLDALRERPENRDKSDEELENALLKEDNPKCKVFVTATSASFPDQTTVLTSYESDRWPIDMLNSVKIWEAARATSAASTFFERIAIGPDSEYFLDGATGANNPVNVVCAEARDVWNIKDSIDDHLHCLISVGTGVPNVDLFGKTLKQIGKTLKEMATETEKTAREFFRDHAKLDTEKRYFRFNVDRGLENISLEEAGKRSHIIAATRRYIAFEGTKRDMEKCADTMSVIEWILTSGSIKQCADLEHKRATATAWANLHGISSADLSSSIRWFVKSQEFLDWQSEKSSSVLCYFFDKGTGKSVLLSRLVHSYDQSVWGKKSVFIDLAHSQNEDISPDLIDLHQSLIYQLIYLFPDKLQSLLDFYMDRRISPTRAFNDVAMLQDGLLHCLPGISDKEAIFMLIDSVDKAKGELALGFLKPLLIDAVRKQKRVRILIAGRPLPAGTLRDDLERFPTISVDTERKHCRDSLFFPEWELRKSIVEMPLKHTTDWVFEHQSFVQWNSSSSVLWINGKPGSGKSTIARRIADEFATQDARKDFREVEFRLPAHCLSNATVVDFFYSSRLGEKAILHYFMLKSILLQILRNEPSLFPHYQKTYRGLFDLAGHGPKWSMKSLQDVFKSLVLDESTKRKPIICILDGFDESELSEESSRSETATSPLLDWLADIAAARGKRAWLKLLVLSRPDVAIDRSLGQFPQIVVENHNKQAIEDIIGNGIGEMKNAIRRWVETDNKRSGRATHSQDWEPRADELLQTLRTNMIERHGGTIQWAVSVLNELRRSFQLGYFSFAELEEILNNIPAGLKNLYQELVGRLYRRLDERKREKATNMLRWICFTHRPLNLREFSDAIALSEWESRPRGSSKKHFDVYRSILLQSGDWFPVKRDILNTCGCLLEVVRPKSIGGPHPELEEMTVASKLEEGWEGLVIQVTHETVREFLIPSSPDVEYGNPKSEAATPFILYPVLSKQKIASELVSYLISCIPMPNCPTSKPVRYWEHSDYRKLAEHLQNRPLLSYIIGYFWKFHCGRDSWTKLARHAAFLQNDKNAQHAWCLLEGWLPFGNREVDGKTYQYELGTEIKQDSLNDLKRWLELEAGDFDDGTVFSIALASRKRLATLRDNELSSFRKLQLLLSSGFLRAVSDTPDNQASSQVKPSATIFRQMAPPRRKLNFFSDIAADRLPTTTPSMSSVASARAYTPIRRWKRGYREDRYYVGNPPRASRAELESSNSSSNNSPERSDHEESSSTSYVSGRDNYGEVLRTTSKLSDLETSEGSLGSDASLSYRDVIPRLLFLACQLDHTSLVRLILDYFDPTPKDVEAAFGETLRCNPARSTILLQFLHSAGRSANRRAVNFEPSLGRELFSAAVDNRWISIMNLLAVNMDPDINWRYSKDSDIKGRSGQTPLHLAAQYGSTLAAYRLLRGNARFLADKTGKTPLMIAAKKGPAELLRVMVSFAKKQDLLKKDTNGRNALHLAVKSRNSDKVKILLECGLSLHDPDKKGNSPLDIAFDHGDPVILSTLASHSDAPVSLRPRRTSITSDLEAFKTEVRQAWRSTTKIDMRIPTLKRWSSFSVPVERHQRSIQLLNRDRRGSPAEIRCIEIGEKYYESLDLNPNWRDVSFSDGSRQYGVLTLARDNSSQTYPFNWNDKDTLSGGLDTENDNEQTNTNDDEGYLSSDPNAVE